MSQITGVSTGAKFDVPHDAVEDFSGSFGKIRTTVVDANGVLLIDFVKSLKPRYGVVYRDIALGYAFMFGTLALAIVAETYRVAPQLIAVVGALSVGYWLAYLQLFIHEGAHWNLAPERQRSDAICNALISWLAGLRVQNYRHLHFQHHRALGTVDDSEQSYFFPLNIFFFVRTMTGLAVIDVLRLRTEVATKPKSEKPRLPLEAIACLIVHGTIVLGLGYLGFWASAIAWGAGVAIAFPTFGALRQLLEHRNENASASIDYRKQDHGALTRMFGDGPIASTFGGAGFNRHLLHHWEPTVSYTCLKDLEAYLNGTKLGSLIAQRRSSYFRAFRSLFVVRG